MNWIKRAQEKYLQAQKDASRMANQYNMLEQKINSGDNKGDFYQLLGSILSQQLRDGNPNVEGYRQSSEGAINRGFNKSRTKIKEDLAGRGMGSSGAGLAAMAQLGGERATALGNNDLQISDMEENYKQDTLAKLLGLNAFGAGQDQTQFGNLFNILTSQQQQFNINRDYRFQKANQPSEFASLLGSLLGGGAQVATTGFMTNWGNG